MIATENKDIRIWFRKVLEVIGIILSKDKEQKGNEGILIHGLSNFNIVKKYNLTILHPKKFSEFKRGMNGFVSKQFRKGEGRLEVLKLLSRKPMSRQELGKILDKSPDTIKTEELYQLEKFGFVARGEIIEKKRLWKITKVGLKILQTENPIEKLKFRN